MRFTISTLLALVAGTTAVPTSSVSPRQSGGEFHAVGNLYSDGGCTSQSLIFADPIFGPPNLCAPLDRNNNVPPILSYKTISEDTGCTVSLFYDTACSQPVGGFSAVLNGCVQGSRPFEGAIVNCPAPA